MTHLYKTLCLDIETLSPEDRIRLSALALLNGAPAQLCVAPAATATPQPPQWAMLDLPDIQDRQALKRVNNYCSMARRVGASEDFTGAVMRAFGEGCQYLCLTPLAAPQVRHTMYVCVQHLMPGDITRLPALAHLPNAEALTALTDDGAVICVPGPTEALSAAFSQAQRVGFSMYYETLLRAVHSEGAHYVHLAHDAPTLTKLPVFLRRPAPPSPSTPTPS